MATTVVNGSSLGTSLETLLNCDEIVPGAAPSYELCKSLFTYHPLGQKMTEGPIAKAQSQARDIEVPDGPEDDVKDEFLKEWGRIGADKIIRNVGTQARIYGIASLAMLEQGIKPAAPIELKNLAEAIVSFNVLDPLNTAGSLVLNQDPNSLDFQKHQDIAVNGTVYHRSRTVTILNEQPIYIDYTTSAFGFVGRSVFQRALFPLKSFVLTMWADDMVARKAGLIVAKIKPAGSIIDSVMNTAAAFKRMILKVGGTNNVVNITPDEGVESLDLTNLSDPLTTSRKDILENIAAANDMPAVMLNSETFAEGFGEGTEDAKRVAQYLQTIRQWLQPLYEFMDRIVQRRAWNERFYETIQRKFPDQYGDMPYEEAFYRWQNSFTATWPSLLQEPESEKIKVSETRFKTATAAVEVLLPEMDPENKATVLMWFADTLNSAKDLFSSPLNLDYDKLRDYEPPQPVAALEEPKPSKPFGQTDSAEGEREEIRGRIDALEKLFGRRKIAA